MIDTESNVFCGTLDSDADKVTSSRHAPEIKLHTVELSHYGTVIHLLWQNLSPAEIQRAERYRREHDRNRFIICRGLLKHLLAHETGLNVSQIRLEEPSGQKPYLPLDTSLSFNVTHAGKYGLIAIGSSALGVDLEFIDHRFGFNEILPTVFNTMEIDLIQTSKRPIYTFYQLWTRKEAIVKAVGKGIDDDFVKIPVTDGHHAIAPALISGFKTVNVFSFDLDDDYVGALALTEHPQHFGGITFCPLPSPDELKSLMS